ncbi:hypothetical protein Agub_g13983 [Astrephomene gubernaculifera]|uniref:Uncharacterized protein n=1 Tax=Astrephomene gubernaculifera TaxID=47775 RepID=A0AAD3E3A5_9CHLO|nr:hypothetical protein Agub_g13983 [Astrephomene gubernaculifera]
MDTRTQRPRRDPLSLSEVLHTLSIDAIDALYGTFREQGSLAAVRLVCRGLRDVMDGSVRQVKIAPPWTSSRVTHGPPLELSEPKQLPSLPSLARWPRCSSVRLLYGKAGDAQAFTMSTIGLPLAVRKRITHLAVENKECALPEPESILSLLLRRLPSLRELELHTFLGMSYMPTQQQLLYDSLSSLPHLERLTLPSCRALECLGILSESNLSSLTIDASNSPQLTRMLYSSHPSMRGEGAVLTDELALNLAHLGKLQNLTIQGCCLARDSEGPQAGYRLLRHLLCALPVHTKRSLRLQDCKCAGLAGALNLHLRFDAGSMVPCVEVGSAELPDLAAMVAPEHGLLQCALAEYSSLPQPQASTRPVMSIDELIIDQSGFLTDELLQRLRALQQQQCQQLLLRGVKTLTLGLHATLEAVLQVVEVLGSPGELGLQVVAGRPGKYACGKELLGIKVLLSGAGGGGGSCAAGSCRAAVAAAGSAAAHAAHAAQAGVAGHAAQAAGSADQPSLAGAAAAELPSAEQLLRNMVARWEATGEVLGASTAAAGAPAFGGVQAARAEASAASAAKAATAAAAVSFEPASSEVLLLKGPFVAVLTQGSVFLNNWMQLLEKHAVAATAAATSSAGNGSGGGISGRCVEWYQVVQTSVLVQCGSRAKAAAVAAAARALMEAALGGGGLRPPVQVVAVKVASRCRVQRREDNVDGMWLDGSYLPLRSFVLRGFEQAVQEAWDGAPAAAAAGEAGQEQEQGAVISRGRLEWLLGLRNVVASLPKMVWMQQECARVMG